MGNVFIPLGGAGGKNRGDQYSIPEDAQTFEMFGSVFAPLPTGVYKKYMLPNGKPAFPAVDGGTAVVSMSKEFLKKQAINTFGIASITNFSATMYAHKQVRLTWSRPNKGLWSGVHFVFKYDSMPTSVTDGFLQIDSADVHYESPLLREGQLYVRAYNYVTTNEGRWYDNGNVSANTYVSSINGSVTFGAGAGTWTVPANVYKIRYIAVGQGGMGSHNGGYRLGGPGGGGGYFATGYMNVTPGQQISWLIPSIVTSKSTSRDDYVKYYDGGHLPAFDTIFGSVRAEHGRTGYLSNISYNNFNLIGGSGGSGGGGGNGGLGGTNGADGTVGRNGSYAAGGSTYSIAGKGSGVSTLGFNGVLYCSGGNAGENDQSWNLGSRGTDGLGNGGNGTGGGTFGKTNDRSGGTGCIYIAWGSSMNDGS